MAASKKSTSAASEAGVNPPQLNGKSAASHGSDDLLLRKIGELLERDYLAAHPRARIAVKRFSPESLRIRIIDPAFDGILLTERDAEVWSILEQLSDDCFRQIGMLVLVSPKETSTSWANQEFEAGSPGAG